MRGMRGYARPPRNRVNFHALSWTSFGIVSLGAPVPGSKNGFVVTRSSGISKKLRPTVPSPVGGKPRADIRESGCCRAQQHQRLKPSSRNMVSHTPMSPLVFPFARPPPSTPRCRRSADLAGVALFRASQSLFPARSPLRGGTASRLADRPPGISLAVNIRGCMSVHLSVRMVHPAVLLILRAFRWSAILRFFPLYSSLKKHNLPSHLR